MDKRSIHPAASGLLTGTRFRFTVRTPGGKILRRYMSASRFLTVQAGYLSDAGNIRVDVTDTENGAIQTWDITLNKIFWA